MKKKFVLVLALVLVGSLAFAGFNFSGEALVGYKFDLANGGVSTYGYDAIGNDTTAYFSMNATTDYAKVAFRNAKSGNSAYNYELVKAQLSLYLDKALAAKEVKLPVSVTLTLGNADNSGFYSYLDPDSIVDDNYDGFGVNTRDDYPIGIDVGYEGYTARTMFDIVGSEVNPLVSIKGTPIEGVGFAASFVGASNYLTDSTSEFNLSATVDVAKLADLDFDLKASAFTVLGLGDPTDDPIVLAAVTGGKDALSAYVEYSLNAVEDNANSDAGSRIFGGVSYAFTDVTVGGGVDYQFVDTITSYSAYAKTTLGGITYKASIGGDTTGAAYLKAQAYIAF